MFLLSFSTALCLVTMICYLALSSFTYGVSLCPFIVPPMSRLNTCMGGFKKRVRKGIWGFSKFLGLSGLRWLKVMPILKNMFV